jgi:peptidoglycan/LPS O-acetylase OafA/YrhL
MERYDALTGIRFIAAFAVFVAHFGHFDFGAQGVSLFFVLSGFILTKVYTAKTWTLGQFYWARFARIYPAYLFSLIVALPVFWSAIRTHESIPAFVGSVLLMLHAWMPDTAHYWNNPSWSLSAEALFYLIFPFALALLNLRVRYLVAIVLGLWTLQTWNQVTGDYSDGGQFISKFPLFRLPEFLIGIAFGWMHGKMRIPFAVPLSVAVIVLAGIFMPTGTTYTALAPVYGLLLLGLTEHRGWLASKPLVLLGEASYSFYLLHMPVILWIYGLERMTGIALPMVVKAPLLFTITLAMSLFSLLVIERPARKWLLGQRFFRTVTQS